MLKTRSVVVWLLAVGISAIVLVWGLDFARQGKPKPFYQGRPLEYWFNQLPMTSINGQTVGQSRHLLARSPSGEVKRYGAWMETPEASAKAISFIGTNALAFCLWKLTRHIGPLESKIQKIERAVGFHSFLFLDVSVEREQAVTALILLKPLPPEVIAELGTLSTNRNQEIADAAHCALTTDANGLMLLHSPDSKHSVDADLLKIRIPPDFYERLTK